MGFWDPAGLSADGSVENFKRRRATEIKHGRIAMLATMGYITPEITGKFPGYLSPSAGLKFADIPNGLAAISKVPQAGWGQILLYMAYCEVSQTQEPGTAAYAGDFGFKVLTSSDPAEKTKKLNAEIANGRLAMMAIIGMFFQAYIQSSKEQSYLFRASLHQGSHSRSTLQRGSFNHRNIPLTGWSHWQRLGRLGQLHRLAFASIRERAWSAGPRRILGPRWLYFRWRRRILQAPTLCGVEARKDFHDGCHGCLDWIERTLPIAMCIYVFICVLVAFWST